VGSDAARVSRAASSRSTVAATLAASGSPITINAESTTSPAWRGLPLNAFVPVHRHIRPSSSSVPPNDGDDDGDVGGSPNTQRSRTSGRSRSRLAARHQLTAPPKISGPKLTEGGWRWPPSPQSVIR
jgi:hypothetical protein